VLLLIPGAQADTNLPLVLVLPLRFLRVPPGGGGYMPDARGGGAKGGC
jgi:hypothetical protein